MTEQPFGNPEQLEKSQTKWSHKMTKQELWEKMAATPEHKAYDKAQTLLLNSTRIGQQRKLIKAEEDAWISLYNSPAYFAWLSHGTWVEYAFGEGQDD